MEKGDNENDKMPPNPTGQQLKNDPSSNSVDEIDEDDINEIVNVNNNIDSINSVLDVIEQRTDSIRAQLMELLTSNREIRQMMQEENLQTQSNKDCAGSEQSDGSGEGNDTKNKPETN